MIQGETTITIDDKGRMAVPTAYRDTLAGLCGGRLVFAYNPFDAFCLWLFPAPEWERVRDLVAPLSSFNPAHRELKRKLVGSACPVEPDGQHRVLVPPSMRLAAGIEKRAVLLGLGDKFELWSEEAHLKRIATTISAEDITAEMQSLRF
ncbi:MAG: division/cell wall cluster transcriptional repressor MraZ [Pseudoxanthomonas sp.]|nr:division/cell wall cluster transcriptional repressor MraZ [Pseudoxanthomonas sp.]